jgi:predicted nucleic acid-binding protein
VICIDANIVLAWLLPEELSAKAIGLRRAWQAQGEDLVAPGLLRYEVTSVLRFHVFRGNITVVEGDEAFSAYSGLSLDYVEVADLGQRAWEIAKHVGSPRAYDMFYVALAEMQDCLLWTCDRRLSNLVAPHFPFIRWVGSATAGEIS